LRVPGADADTFEDYIRGMTEVGDGDRQRGADVRRRETVLVIGGDAGGSVPVASAKRGPDLASQRADLAS
jgi:hypothetical protein